MSSSLENETRMKDDNKDGQQRSLCYFVDCIYVCVKL